MIFRLAIHTKNKDSSVSKELVFKDEDDITSLFSRGKAPSTSKPPRPLNEVIVPKVKLESVQKPKLTTGAFKPKPKVFIIYYVSVE